MATAPQNPTPQSQAGTITTLCVNSPASPSLSRPPAWLFVLSPAAAIQPGFWRFAQPTAQPGWILSHTQPSCMANPARSLAIIRQCPPSWMQNPYAHHPIKVSLRSLCLPDKPTLKPPLPRPCSSWPFLLSRFSLPPHLPIELYQLYLPKTCAL